MLKSATILFTLAALPAAFAQQAISVQSGLIHYIEGRVEKQGVPLKMEIGKFPSVQQGETLATLQGRAEVLLTPGVFLRLGTQSSVRMISTALTDTQLEVVSGAALVEVAEIGKFTRVRIRTGESEASMDKPGLYLFDAAANRIRVFEGKATVAMRGQTLTIGRGRQALLGAELAQAKFNLKERELDALYAWSSNRADLMAQANVKAATAYRSNGYRMSTSMWAFYPGLGLVTFLPYSGYCRSAFGGWGYYSPGSIWQYYTPRYEQPSYGGGDSRPSWSGMGGGSGGYSPAPGSGSVSAASVDSGRASAPASAPAVAPAEGGSRGR